MERVAVVGAAIIRNGEVLVARRSADMALPGKWEFPGGKIEKDETPRQSLIREIEEELGAQIAAGDYLGSGSSVTADRRIELDVYRCTLLSGTPRPIEHAELRWIGPAEIDSLDWASADVPVLSALKELLSSESGH